MATNQGCRGLIPCEQLHYKFLYYFLTNSVRLLNDLGTGTTFKELSATKLKGVSIPLPPLPKQKQIVAILDKAFAAIETATANTKKNLANARELFESQLNQTFQNIEFANSSSSRAVDIWRLVPFIQCIEPVETPIKIPRKQFKKSGQFPIVSQEKDLINGYWCDESSVVSVDSPLIVFGDHTKILKFIDFDFVVGADGVKLLKPKSFLNAKYFYYFLMANSLADLGYARHYRLLKELKIGFPQSISEQKRIAEKLDMLSAEIRSLSDTYNTKLNALANLKQALLHKSFCGKL